MHKDQLILLSKLYRDNYEKSMDLSLDLEKVIHSFYLWTIGICATAVALLYFKQNIIPNDFNVNIPCILLLLTILFGFIGRVLKLKSLSLNDDVFARVCFSLSALEFPYGPRYVGKEYSNEELITFLESDWKVDMNLFLNNRGLKISDLDQDLLIKTYETYSKENQERIDLANRQIRKLLFDEIGMIEAERRVFPKRSFAFHNCSRKFDMLSIICFVLAIFYLIYYQL